MGEANKSLKKKCFSNKFKQFLTLLTILRAISIFIDFDSFYQKARVIARRVIKSIKN
jgi:hypothetical protein